MNNNISTPLYVPHHKKSSATKMRNIIFGPIASRRFGRSLGIDLSPSGKQCNFDCVYCELHKAAPMDAMEVVLPPHIIIQAIMQALSIHTDIDVLTFTATGEPTLYPYLDDVITAIAPILPKHTRSLILSNGSLFLQQAVALAKFDIVKFSLDAITPKAFKRVDRPSKMINLQDILQGITSFAAHYQGELVAEILLVEGHNDDEENLHELAHFLRGINVARIDISTIDRPSAYRVRALSPEKLASLQTIFTNLPISLPKRIGMINATNSTYTRSKEELLKLIATRPMSCEEAPTLLNHTELALVESMLNTHLHIAKQGEHMFYVVMDSHIK